MCYQIHQKSNLVDLSRNMCTESFMLKFFDGKHEWDFNFRILTVVFFWVLELMTPRPRSWWEVTLYHVFFQLDWNKAGREMSRMHALRNAPTPGMCCFATNAFLLRFCQWINCEVSRHRDWMCHLKLHIPDLLQTFPETWKVQIQTLDLEQRRNVERWWMLMHLG